MHMCYNIFTPLGYGGVACLKQRLGPKLEGAGLGEHPKNWDPYVFLQPLKLATSNLVHNLGLGLAYQKQHFGPQLASVLARGASKNNCDPPMYFLQLLKLTTSNLVHKLGLELAYQKRRLLPKLAGVWAREASKKIWDPLCIFSTVEASNFKFGTQLWFGTSLPIKNVLDQNWRGVGQGSIPKNLGPPTYFCNSGS